MKLCKVWACKPETEQTANGFVAETPKQDSVVLPKQLVDSLVAEAVDSALEEAFPKHAFDPVPEKPTKVRRKAPKDQEAPKSTETACAGSPSDLKWVYVALVALAVLMVFLAASVHTRMSAMEAWLHGRLTV